MPTSLLIFDLDGTLIDSRADLAAGINHMRTQCGMNPISTDTVSSYIGDGVIKLIQRSLQGNKVELEEALGFFKTYYLSHLTIHTTLYDGVKEGIARLAETGHQLALLTNKPGDPSRSIMKHFGLDKHFIRIIGSGDIAELKPSPAGIFECIKASGLANERAWMIGDHYTDLAAGQNAGIKKAFVQYGFGEERGYKPTTYFASFSELVSYFV